MRLFVLAALAAAFALVFSTCSPPQQACDVAWIGDSIFSTMGHIKHSPPFERVCNLGKSGAPAAVIAKMRVPNSARVVFFEGGINDILSGWPDEGIFEAYKDGIARLAGRDVVAIGILPVSQKLMSEDYAKYATPERILQVNSGIRVICSQFPHCRWTRSASSLSADQLTTDGIHLSGNGQVALVALLSEDMRRD